MNYDMKLFSKRLQKVRGEKTQVEFSKELGIATAGQPPKTCPQIERES